MSDETDIPPEIAAAYKEAKSRGLPDGWTCSIDVSSTVVGTGIFLFFRIDFYITRVDRVRLILYYNNS